MGFLDLILKISLICAIRWCFWSNFLMEIPNNHLRCIEPCKWWDIYLCCFAAFAFQGLGANAPATPNVGGQFFVDPVGIFLGTFFWTKKSYKTNHSSELLFQPCFFFFWEKYMKKQKGYTIQTPYWLIYMHMTWFAQFCPWMVLTGQDLKESALQLLTQQIGPVWGKSLMSVINQHSQG